MNEEKTVHIVPPKRIEMAAVLALILLAVFLLFSAIGVLQSLGHSVPAANTITVEGTGKATAVPNIANITFTVMESAATVDAAQTAATDKTNAAIAALGKEGIDSKDVQTSSYNVSPQYASNNIVPPCAPGTFCPDYIVNGGSQRIIGYQVSETIDVKVRDTAKAGTILQDLGTLGVENIYGPNFTVDDDQAVNDEARAAAIADARARAQVLAHDLGVRLGDVVNYSENGGGYPMPMYASYGKDSTVSNQAAPPQLPVGQNETTMTVSVTYEIR